MTVSRAVADRNLESFHVSYGGSTICLTREQLLTAPESLLSRLLLTEMQDAAKQPLVIPSEDTAPGVAAWRDGSLETFEVSLKSH